MGNIGNFWRKLFEKKEEPIIKIIKEEKNEASGVALMKRMVSHNVRMPMAVITGYGELLKRGLLSDKEKEECIRVVCENITYMNQCLGMIFGEETEINIPEERVDVVELSRKMKNYVNDIARKIPIFIDVPQGTQPLYIQAEEIQMMKIFYQLFENVFKYVAPGGKVQILIYPVEEKQMMVVFKDNGNSLTKEEIPNLFEQGFRGKNSISQPGNGFGLYNGKQIVEQYHGTVTVSGGDENGFSVVMIFPAA